MCQRDSDSGGQVPRKGKGPRIAKWFPDRDDLREGLDPPQYPLVNDVLDVDESGLGLLPGNGQSTGGAQGSRAEEKGHDGGDGDGDGTGVGGGVRWIRIRARAGWLGGEQPGSDGERRYSGI
jgi:hypothetical protein